ncbi:sensor histidine kinase [Sphingomonas sp. MMS12-HWE2-04]|uniref:sensor histidine kinase n=1 Tax=Sphingomonas sp. MMS12-HWE2-04 TaxID=3234199 RepID=UPI00384A70E3
MPALGAASAAELLGAHEVRPVLERWFERSRAELGLDLFFHYRFEQGAGLMLEAHGGLTPDQAAAGFRLQLGDAIGEAAIRERRTVLVDVARSTDPASEFARELGLDAYLCLPLVHRGEVLGTLAFGRRGGSFDEIEVAALETVAAQLGFARHRIALERALRSAHAERDRLLLDKREMEEKVVELSRVSALGAVAATIAHELNQPLAAAANFVAAIRLDPNPSEGRVAELSGAAEKQFLRAGEIIRRIRRMVAREALALEADDLAPIIDDALALVRAAARGPVPAIDVVLGDNATRAVVDHVQLVQILANLLRNAAEATETLPEARVTIETRRLTAREVEVRVVDNGPGVPWPVRAALFQPRAGLSRRGLGLGLSIARNLVEAHGGGIHIEDTPGGGATFVFTLAATRD